MIDTILVMSQQEAENQKPYGDVNLISIKSPDTPPVELKEGWSNILKLDFHDTDGFLPRKGLKLITDKQANQIIEFLTPLYKDNKKHMLVVHCTLGLSRSAAVALFAHMFFTDKHIPFSKYPCHNRYVLSVLEKRYRLTQCY